MIERAGRTRFLFEAVHAVGEFGERRRQDFDRDVAADAGVMRAIHLAHPARADAGDDLVGAESGSWLQGHWTGAL